MTANPSLLTFTHAARECAMQMMDNATYIQRELPPLDLPEEIGAKIHAMCDSLIGNKHDVMTEVFELADETETDASKRSEKVQRILQWLWEPIGEMHQVVTTLETAIEPSPHSSPAFLLVVESATNILNVLFNATGTAADALHPPKRA